MFSLSFEYQSIRTVLSSIDSSRSTEKSSSPFNRLELSSSLFNSRSICSSHFACFFSLVLSMGTSPSLPCLAHEYCLWKTTISPNDQSISPRFRQKSPVKIDVSRRLALVDWNGLTSKWRSCQPRSNIAARLGEVICSSHLSFSRRFSLQKSAESFPLSFLSLWKFTIQVDTNKKKKGFSIPSALSSVPFSPCWRRIPWYPSETSRQLFL